MRQNSTSNLDSTAKQYPQAESVPDDSMDKVAERLATYVATPVKKSAPAQHSIAGIPADDEVWRFAGANDLVPHLETAIRLVWESFSDVCTIKLSYEPDPEISKFNSVVIQVKAAGTVEELFEQEKKYIRAFGRVVPYESSYKIVLFVSVA